MRRLIFGLVVLLAVAAPVISLGDSACSECLEGSSTWGECIDCWLDNYDACVAGGGNEDDCRIQAASGMRECDVLPL